MPGEESPKKAIENADVCSGIDGGPACVRACPTGAAIRVSPETFLSVARMGEGRPWAERRFADRAGGRSRGHAAPVAARPDQPRGLPAPCPVPLAQDRRRAQPRGDRQFAADIEPRPNGGSWYGYLLGTIGALLIVWLSLIGIRKRAMTPGKWSLKAWTSAHVYLGLSLIVVATLHTGFQLGWNVHTLAYGLMLLVIASGVFGIVVYANLPQALSNNREQMTQRQMIEAVQALDRQLQDAAQPLGRGQADLVIAALAEDPFGGGIARRLSGRYPGCATARAIEGLGLADARGAGDPASDKVVKLLIRRRRSWRVSGGTCASGRSLEIWLYVHVPATFALIAALFAHILSVFFYW